MEVVENIVTAIRNIRGEMNIPPSKKINVLLKTNEVSERQIDYIKKLARVEDLKAGENIVKPKASASAVVKSSEIYIPLEGLIDLDVERQRLQKEITRLEGSLAGMRKNYPMKSLLAVHLQMLLKRKEQSRETGRRI